MKELGSFIYFFIALATGMIGYQIHHSGFWSVIDFLFYPIVWVKWLVFQEVNLTIIKSAFAFFFQ
jgi:hypothetical protein